MKKEFKNKGLHERLQHYSSKELLDYVQERNDTYFEGIYYKEDLINLGLAKWYHEEFIAICDDGYRVKEAIDLWICDKEEYLEDRKSVV